MDFKDHLMKKETTHENISKMANEFVKLKDIENEVNENLMMDYTEYNGDSMNLDEYISIFQNSFYSTMSDWYIFFFSSMFLWDKVPEGKKYWGNIQDEFSRFVENKLAVKH